MATNDTSNKLQADGPGCIYHKQNSLLICIFVYPCKCCVCNRNCGCCNQVFFHGEYQIFFVRQRSRVRKNFLIHFVIKFCRPKPSSSCPKCFARFLSRMKLIRKQMKWPRYGTVNSNIIFIYPYFVKYEVCLIL